MAKSLCLAGLFLISPLLRAAENPFGEKFWRRWSDGKAEISTYDLTIPRFGSPRRGTLLVIFSPEQLSDKQRVAAAPGKHAAEDVFRVMRLNLLRQFPTGLADCRMMTSVFLGLTGFGGFPRGSVAKVSFSTQEWGGQLYRQVLFRSGGAEETWHSYMAGEGDGLLGHKGNYAASEDALALWARGFASPFVEGDGSRVETLFTSLDRARMDQTAARWRRAAYRRRPGREEVEVPAGKFTVEVCDVEVEKGRHWTFYVEAKGDRRLVKYTASDGETAELVASARMDYAQVTEAGREKALEKLGLPPTGRAGHTP